MAWSWVSGRTSTIQTLTTTYQSRIQCFSGRAHASPAFFRLDAEMRSTASSSGIGPKHSSTLIRVFSWVSRFILGGTQGIDGANSRTEHSCSDFKTLEMREFQQNHFRTKRSLQFVLS